MDRKSFACLAIVFLCVAAVHAQSPATFANPLLPAGADPWSIYKDGYYYYTHTLGNRIAIWKTKNLANLATAERSTIFTPPRDSAWSRNLWAPEIHYLQGKWYVYFAADNGKNENHRVYVLENSSADPLQGEWRFIGKIADPSDKWAIDGSVFEHNKQLYMVWSGWEGDINRRQDIYIAKMKNPWTIGGKRVRISSPVFDWEKHGDLNDPNNPPHVDVNEGPQLLRHNGHVYLIYSASGCWTEYYSLGMLTLKGNNLLDSASWQKHPQPVFTRSEENRVFAPGHNSFFKSPNGKEDWILYHANGEPGLGCGRHRSPRAQKFTWKADGTPDFGLPVKTGTPLPIPAEK